MIVKAIDPHTHSEVKTEKPYFEFSRRLGDGLLDEV